MTNARIIADSAGEATVLDVTAGTAAASKAVVLDGSKNIATLGTVSTGALTVGNTVLINGTTPTLTIGDAGAEDTKIVFDGNAQDFHIGLDDSVDDLIIGKGSALGTTPAITINENLQTTIANHANPKSAFRNLAINGDMHIWQRTIAATAMGNGTYSTVDRWVMYEGTDGAVTTEQSVLSVADKGTTGCANALLAKCTTADTSIAAGQYVIIEQRIEAQYLQHLGYGTSSAKSLTVSFWVKAYVAGTYNVALRKQDSTAYYISQEYTVDSSNTWEYKTLTFSPTAGSTSLITSANGVINNDSGEGIRLDFQLTLGSNFHATTNTWNSSIAGIGSSNQTNFVSSTDNTFYLTGVQLEVGSTATDFEHLPRDVNLQRCQRYFYNLSSLGPYVPASEAAYLGAGFYYTSSFVIAMINLPTAMRTEPSLTTSNASNSFMFYRNGEGDNMDDLSLNGSSSAICVTVGNNSDVSGTAGMGGGLVVQAGTICNLSAEI